MLLELMLILQCSQNKDFVLWTFGVCTIVHTCTHHHTKLLSSRQRSPVFGSVRTSAFFFLGLSSLWQVLHQIFQQVLRVPQEWSAVHRKWGFAPSTCHSVALAGPFYSVPEDRVSFKSNSFLGVNWERQYKSWMLCSVVQLISSTKSVMVGQHWIPTPRNSMFCKGPPCPGT